MQRLRALTHKHTQKLSRPWMCCSTLSHLFSLLFESTNALSMYFFLLFSRLFVRFDFAIRLVASLRFLCLEFVCKPNGFQFGRFDFVATARVPTALKHKRKTQRRQMTSTTFGSVVCVLGVWMHTQSETMDHLCIRQTLAPRSRILSKLKMKTKAFCVLLFRIFFGCICAS